MTKSSINALSVGVLKSILFTNHVNATMILEKSELVSKVMALVDDERRERERQRLAERLEEDRRRTEREEREQEDRRRREEEWLRTERRESHGTRLDEAEDGTDNMDINIEVVDEDEDQATPCNRSTRHADHGGQTEAAVPATPPETSATPEKLASFRERSGLCVICQDEEANIAIVDCGYVCSPFTAFLAHVGLNGYVIQAFSNVSWMFGVGHGEFQGVSIVPNQDRHRSEITADIQVLELR